MSDARQTVDPEERRRFLAEMGWDDEPATAAIEDPMEYPTTTTAEPVETRPPTRHPTLNADAALNFLTIMRGDGPRALCAIGPKPKEIRAATFRPDERDQLIAWLRERDVAGANLYFMPNDARPGCENRKAKESDVPAALWLQVDKDFDAPPPDADVAAFLAAERARIVAALRAFPIPPTVILFSGGGLQGFWRLREAATAPEQLAAVKLTNIAIASALGADSCQSLEHIFRLAGTVNRPDEKKRKKGRTLRLAELVEHHPERAYSLDDFAALVESEKVALRAKVETGPAAEFDPDAKPAKLVALLASDAKLAEMYARDVDEDDDSKLDYRIELHVLMATKGDAELAEQAARHSRWEHLADDKALRRDDYWAKHTTPAAVAAFERERAANHARFDAAALPPSTAVERKSPLEELNERFVVVPEGSDTFVYERVDGPRGGWKRRKVSAFKSLLANRSIEVPIANGGSRVEPIAEHWFKWGGRSTAAGVGCFPEGGPPNWLNTWMGWAVKPDSSQKCGLIFELVEVLANHDPTVVRYILDWAANMVQRPGSPGEVGLVLMSEQGGTGKNTFLSKVLGAIAGPHGIELSSSVARNFNAHLRDAVYLHCVEAFWAGDHRATAMLKNMITEGGLFFEPKGVDGAMAPNMLHIALSSNADWVFPAHLDERRFMASRVSEEKVGDKPFWDALNEEIENGGLSGFLAHLLDRDIRGRHPRQNIPQTAALIEQKLESLSPIEGLWLEWLRAGSVPTSQFDDDRPISWEEGPVRLAAADVQAALRARMGRGPAADRAAATAVGRTLRRLCRGIRRERSGPGRAWVYLVPPLAEARAAFEKAIGGAVKLDWEEG